MKTYEKHEWKIKKFYHKPSEKEYLEIVWSDDGECVTELVYEKEDAELIAAAPDLLKAAEKILNENYDIILEGQYDLEKAIEKAKGDK